MHDKLLDKSSRLAEQSHTGDAIRWSPPGGQGILEPAAARSWATLEAVVAAAVTVKVG